MVNKIVVLCISPIGDTLFATPAIRALRDSFSWARIVVLAGCAAYEVLRNNPFNLELVRVTNICSLYKALSWVRDQNFDLALGFSRFGSIFTKLCGAVAYADFSTIEFSTELSAIEACLEVLRIAGQRINLNITGNLVKTDYWLTPQDLRMVDRFLECSGYGGDQPLVAIHSGGHYFSRKRWPVPRFIELIRRLSCERGFQVVLVGGKEDLASALAIRMVEPKTMTAVGILKLSETGALLKRCQLFIGNDSGPLHLAAALGTPTVALFGPTHPRQFYPYPPDRHQYLIKELACHPCYRLGGAVWQFIPRCPKAYCMEAISVDEVIQVVGRVLDLSAVGTS
ncbi:MAG TPA: glycosyltransferase family 9 protein [Bacillota bacterium]